MPTNREETVLWGRHINNDGNGKELPSEAFLTGFIYNVKRYSLSKT